MGSQLYQGPGLGVHTLKQAGPCLAATPAASRTLLHAGMLLDSMGATYRHTDPSQSLGLLAELDPADACAVDPASGELKFGWSNICLHYFKRSWLADVSDRLAAEGKYHIARKKIPSKAGPVQVGGRAHEGGCLMLSPGAAWVRVDCCLLAWFAWSCDFCGAALLRWQCFCWGLVGWLVGRLMGGAC